jgi:hypothetical protein
MNPIKFFFFISFVLLMNEFCYSQYEDEKSGLEHFLLPDGLGISNQLEYSYDINKKLEILENWLNVDYRKGIFSAGIRLDVFQPNDPNPAVNRGKIRYADIAYKYLKVELGDAETGGELTIGNFYTLFGRGLILKSYEDRNIRIDNNLLGVKVSGSYGGFNLTALTGMPESVNMERKDILHTVDLEYKGIEGLKIGGTFASNHPKNDNISKTRMASIRIQPRVWNFDFYGEYGIKQNADTKNFFKGEESLAGKAFYGNLNFFYESFSLSSEYKYYDNFGFKTNDQTVDYNTPPSVRKEYTYLLLNRHPSPLNADNEKGFQIEANYNLSDEIYFSINYGETKTLPASSLYQRINQTLLEERTQLKEFYAQANHSFIKDLHTIAALGYNEELDGNTKNITPILENKFYLDETTTLRLILEHQLTTARTTNEQYYTDVVTFEYLKSPKLSISLVTEMETTEPTAGRKVRKVWGFVQVGYKIGNHTDVSVLCGSRQAGNICIGGVCRYEPEFNGVELKMFTRF